MDGLVSNRAANGTEFEIPDGVELEKADGAAVAPRSREGKTGTRCAAECKIDQIRRRLAPIAAPWSLQTMPQEGGGN